MARGASLLELTGELRAELGRAPNLSVGPGDIPMLQRTLRRIQKVLWTQYEWPFMRRVFPLIPLAAGQNMYDPPDTLDIDRIENMAVWQNNVPVPIRRGIGWDEYSSFKPGDRADPAQKWDMRTHDDFTNQIEIWPTPASENYGLQIIGIRNLRPFTHDAHLCDLDDEVIIMFAAAQILARQGNKDAETVLTQANAHLSKLRAKASADGEPVRMSLGPNDNSFSRRSRISVAGYPVPT